MIYQKPIYHTVSFFSELLPTCLQHPVPSLPAVNPLAYSQSQWDLNFYPGQHRLSPTQCAYDDRAPTCMGKLPSHHDHAIWRSRVLRAKHQPNPHPTGLVWSKLFWGFHLTFPLPHYIGDDMGWFCCVTTSI